MSEPPFTVLDLSQMRVATMLIWEGAHAGVQGFVVEVAAIVMTTAGLRRMVTRGIDDTSAKAEARGEEIGKSIGADVMLHLPGARRYHA